MFSKLKAHRQTELFFEKANKNSLLWLTPKIIDKFLTLMDALNNVKDGYIVSSHPLTKEEFEERVEFTERVYLGYKFKFRAKLRVDPSLVKGWEARIGPDTYGHTYATKLRGLKKFFDSEISELNTAMEKSLSRV